MTPQDHDNQEFGAKQNLLPGAKTQIVTMLDQRFVTVSRGIH